MSGMRIVSLPSSEFLEAISQFNGSRPFQKRRAWKSATVCNAVANKPEIAKSRDQRLNRGRLKLQRSEGRFQRIRCILVVVGFVVAPLWLGGHTQVFEGRLPAILRMDPVKKGVKRGVYADNAHLRECQICLADSSGTAQVLWMRPPRLSGLSNQPTEYCWRVFSFGQGEQLCKGGRPAL